MHDEDAFLRAIQAEPQNDLRKLVYADWLEERGRDGEAAFIRDNIPPRDPKPWSPIGTRDERVGQAWWDLYSGVDRIWDARTMLALGRLQGMLEGFAAANDHTADISFRFDALLEPLTDGRETRFDAVLKNGTTAIPVEEEWRTVIQTEVARWIGIHQGTWSSALDFRRAHQTPDGCQYTAARVVALVAEVIRPSFLWRLEPPPTERWGIDYTVLMLVASDRVLTLSFDFDD